MILYYTIGGIWFFLYMLGLAEAGRLNRQSKELEKKMPKLPKNYFINIKSAENGKETKGGGNK